MIRQVVTIDGTSFDVGVEYIKRQARIEDGPNAGNSKRGDWIRDVYGTFYDYILAFDTSSGLSREDYDTMYGILTAPVEFHTLVVPYGQSTLSFQAGITGAEDNVILMDDGTVWGNLSITFRAKSPQRLATEASNGT
jgi:hypothetical protein